MPVENALVDTWMRHAVADGGDWLQSSRDFWVSYAVAAGGAWLLAYVFFKKRWWLRKVIQRDPRPSDVRREIGGSLLAGGIFGLTAVGTLWLRELGWTQIYSEIDAHGWVWFWSSIVIAIIVHDAYFYWTHRLMHHRALFRWFHRVHHESKNPSPWASYCFGPLEAVVQAGIMPLLLIALPMHLLAFGVFMGWQIMVVVLGHTGYECFPPWLMDLWLGKLLNTPTNHVQHHEKLRCNYGLYLNLWDRLMGTNHRDYESRFREVTTRAAQGAPIEPAIVWTTRGETGNGFSSP